MFAAGDTTAALATLHANQKSHAAELAKATGSANAFLASHLSRFGDTTDARVALATAIEKSAHEYVREDAIATTYFQLGDIDRSIDWWRRSVVSNGVQVIQLAKHPRFAPLRKDPCIQALLTKAGIR